MTQIDKGAGGKSNTQKHGKPSSNFAIYAIVAVGVIYLIVRVVLHMTGGE
ncbi:MAG: hypothetical protein O7C75_01120 [Verrucomicrobia bacterium]|nr:hypothetical protein [Verrucomicrobiota bacterium]